MVADFSYYSQDRLLHTFKYAVRKFPVHRRELIPRMEFELNSSKRKKVRLKQVERCKDW